MLNPISSVSPISPVQLQPQAPAPAVATPQVAAPDTVSISPQSHAAVGADADHDGH